MSGESKGVRRRWWWRWLRVTLIVIGALLLLIAGTRLFLFYRLRSAISEIRERGVPVTSAELAVMYGPAAGHGAMDPFGAAFKALGDRDPAWGLFTRGGLLISDNGLSAEMKWEIAACLAENDEAMGLMEKALAGGSCQTPVLLDRRRGGTGVERTGGLELFSRLFYLRALMAVEQRQPDEAVRAILTQFALARSLGEEVLSRQRLARSAIVQRAVRDIECALNARILDDRHFDALDKALREEEAHDCLLRVIRGDRCTGVDLIKVYGSFGPVLPFVYPGESFPGWWRRWTYSMQSQCRRGMDLLLMRDRGYARDGAIAESGREILMQMCDYVGFLQADYLHYLHVMGRLEEIAQMPYPERAVAARELAQGPSSRPALQPYFHRVCEQLLGSGGLVEDAAGVLALLRCARVAMAVERYRMAHGKWPGQLAELTPAFLPELPPSPFTGRPLIYRQWGGHCRVYSPGAGLKDRGGRAAPPSARFLGDIALSLYAPSDPPPAAKCVVRSRRIIMTCPAYSRLTGVGEMELSPTGRQLLLLRRSDSKSSAGGYLHQLAVLDTASGQLADVPIQPTDFTQDTAVGWMDNVFSGKGRYVHVFDKRGNYPDTCLVLYDLDTKRARRFTVRNATHVASDLDETQLWITVEFPDKGNGASGGEGQGRFRLHAFPLGEGKEEQITLPGYISAAGFRECVSVISERGDEAECLLMDLARGTIFETLPVAGNRANSFPAPFWAPGGRFLCHDRCTRFWDRAQDRMFSLEGRTAVAPGPAPHTVFLRRKGDYDREENLRLVDLAGGQEWDLLTPEDGRFICAQGKYLVCAKDDPSGRTTLTLIEIGME
jgi:hypothetical protein